MRCWLFLPLFLLSCEQPAAIRRESKVTKPCPACPSSSVKLPEVINLPKGHVNIVSYYTGCLTFRTTESEDSVMSVCNVTYLFTGPDAVTGKYKEIK